VATATAGDLEMAARIRQHRLTKPPGSLLRLACQLHNSTATFAEAGVVEG